MHALALVLPEKETSPELKLVWKNPARPDDSREPMPIAECRSRRQALKILSLLGEGYIRERRRGDRLIFRVFQGSEPVRLSLLREVRTAA